MRVSCVQLEIRQRPKADTLRHVLALLEQARGSDLILLPEMWPCGYGAFDRYASESEPLDGPTVRALREKASELQTHVLIGSFVERQESDLFNTSLLLDPHGDVIGRYRKIHLFGYGSEERQLLRRGVDVAVVSTPWGRAGLSICYDLRFPELYRRMVERGAEFFLVPAAWPQTRLESWRLFNRARANENLAYLFSCNCVGSQGDLRYAGHGMLVDPFGQVIAEGSDDECLVCAEVDPAQVGAARKEFPALEDRVFSQTGDG
jgi:predicted amidohydrolase